MTRETDHQIQEYIEYLLQNSDAEHPMWNKELVRSGKQNKWNYIDGCMITAILALYEITGDEQYFTFVKCFVDAFTIFQRHEPRTLTAAYRFYCGKNLEDAHSADADTMATYEVLMAQMERYTDLPATVKELSDYLAGDKRMADFAGRILYDQQGKEIFNFGKYKGQRVIDVFRRDRGYYSWLLDGDFPEYTKSVFKRIYLSL